MVSVQAHEDREFHVTSAQQEHADLQVIQGGSLVFGVVNGPQTDDYKSQNNVS